jgi:hypothetical protein
VQITGFAPEQLPFWQVSVWVQPFPSLHVVPLLAIGFEQVPLEGSQVPATWHWSEAVQVTCEPAVQTPPWQLSLRSQRFPSLQVVPS